MSKLTREELSKMSDAEIERQLYSDIYEASQLIEKMEGLGRIFGNGHHARQKIAENAVEELKSRWKRSGNV